MKKSSDNKKETRDLLTTTTKQSGIVFIGKIIGCLFGFLNNFLIAKFFNASVVGEYTIITSIINIVSIFTVFGLDNGLVKYISKYKSLNEKDKLNNIIKISLIYGLTLSVFTSVIVFLLRDKIANIFNDKKLAESIVYGAWIIIPITLLRIFGGIYRGYKKLKHFVISKDVIKWMIFLFLIYTFFILNFKSTVYVVISLLVAIIIAFVYMIINIKNLNLNLKKIILTKSNKSIKKELLSYSSTLIFISFMGVILGKIDRIMLGIYMSSKMVGIYNIAAKIAASIKFLLVSSNMVFSSIISELYSKNKLEVLESLYSTITKWIITLTLPLMVTIIIFSREIIVFFGSEYLIGVNVLIILTITSFIAILPGANGYILNMTGNEKITLINNIVMAFFNITMNILFIPKFGIEGAALATGISIIFVNIIKVIEVKYILGMIPFKKKYIYFFFNLFILIFVSMLLKKLNNNIIAIFISLICNIIIMIGFSYLFRNEFDEMIFKKLGSIVSKFQIK